MVITNAKCCCCFNLRSGTLTIGLLLLIIHGLQTTISIINIINISNHPQYQQDDVLEVSYYSSLAISGIWVLFDALLVRGVSSGNPTLVFAWLCWGIPVSLLAAVGCCLLVFLAIQNDDGTQFYVTVASFLLAIYMVMWYWTFMVLQYYKVMRATERRVVAARTPFVVYVQATRTVYLQSTNPMGNQQPTHLMPSQQSTSAMRNQQPRDPMSNQ